MRDYNILFFLLILSFSLISSKAFSQEILTPCAEKISESCFQGLVPEDEVWNMSIYYESAASANALYYDTQKYELVNVEYDFRNKSSKEYRCQILRRPFNKDTPVSVLFDLIAAAVYSSSYCAGEIFGLCNGETMILSYYGRFAFTDMEKGNCLKLKDIICELIDDIKTDNKEKMYESTPKMKALIEEFRSYYPISSKGDNEHKIVPALR